MPSSAPTVTAAAHSHHTSSTTAAAAAAAQAMPTHQEQELQAVHHAADGQHRLPVFSQDVEADVAL
jgi:hypothetical protein